MSSEGEAAAGKEGGSRWVVVGLSGVTRGGKTTLAASLLSSLPTTTAYISQDEYILPNHHPGHATAPQPLGGINKDTLASVDMKRMMRDVKKVLTTHPSKLPMTDPHELLDRSKVIGCALAEPRPPLKGSYKDCGLPPVLVMDGFLLFEHPEVPPMCHLSYFLTLTREQCQDRGKHRKATSSIITSPLYFDLCVWPKYEECLGMVKGGGVTGVRLLDGATTKEVLAQTVEDDVLALLRQPHGS